MTVTSLVNDNIRSRMTAFNAPILWIAGLQTIGCVFLYYVFSIGLTFYQKWFIKEFHFPLSVVVGHLVIKFLLSVILREILECYNNKKRIILPWATYAKRICAVGITSAFDIGFSNWSFEYITISLYTMLKSSCIIFILIFAIIFGLEKIRWSLIFVVLLIAVGLFLFTYKSTQFNINGFSLVILATVSSGLRWTLAQLVMQKKEIGLSNPVDMVYHIQPWMILGILPLAITFEGLPLVTSNKVFRFDDISIPLTNAALIFIGACLAFLMELSEFLLLFCTSSLSLSICGIIKEVCTLYLAWHVNGDTMSTINLIGLVISLSGITLHVILKSIQARGEPRIEQIEMPLLNSEAAVDDDDEEEITLFQAQNKTTTVKTNSFR